MDDFGTGYSSLRYLKRQPLDQLKIDPSFVQNLAVDKSDRAIVRTIITMAQKQLLRNSGCIHYQGHLFGKPVGVEQFEAFLA